MLAAGHESLLNANGHVAHANRREIAGVWAVARRLLAVVAYLPADTSGVNTCMINVARRSSVSDVAICGGLRFHEPMAVSV
jgi:hypothetical protein